MELAVAYIEVNENLSSLQNTETAVIEQTNSLERPNSTDSLNINCKFPNIYNGQRFIKFKHKS